MKRSYAIYATQGGGIVREVPDGFIFIEAPPEYMGLQIGDYMPEEWGIAALNDPAIQDMETIARYDMREFG